MPCTVIPHLAAGGAERATIEVAEALVAAGATALVVQRRRAAGKRPQPRRPSSCYRLEAAPTRRRSRYMLMPGRIAELVTVAEGLGLVHARSRAPAWSALWAARRTKVPFVTTYHGVYNAKGRLKRLYNSVMARGDRRSSLIPTSPRGTS